MTPAEVREAAAVLVEELARTLRGRSESILSDARYGYYYGSAEGVPEHVFAQADEADDAAEDVTALAAAIRALPLAEEAPPSLAAVLSALPHLTGDELRRVAEAMPRVAGAWKHRTRWGSRPLDGAPKDAADWAHYEDAHAARHVDGWTMAAPYQAVTHVSVPPVATWHPTARAAQAACDARLEADKVRLCGEVIR